MTRGVRGDGSLYSKNVDGQNRVEGIYLAPTD